MKGNNNLKKDFSQVNSFFAKISCFKKLETLKKHLTQKNSCFRLIFTKYSVSIFILWCQFEHIDIILNRSNNSVFPLCENLLKVSYLIGALGI